MALNFVFQSVETEAALKVASMLSLSDSLEQDLVERCESKFTASEVAEVRKTLSFAKSLRSRSSSHPSISVYFSHPVRVAKMAFEMQQNPDVDTVLISLLHNVFEVCDLHDKDLKEAGYRDYVIEAIRLLTIDRNLETNPEYLTDFYGKIEAFGEKLSLIRCLDKVDNLLGLELFEENKVRDSYIDLALHFVSPMAHRLSDEFGRYFEDVVAYMRAIGCKQELKQQYDRFIREHEAD